MTETFCQPSSKNRLQLNELCAYSNYLKRVLTAKFSDETSAEALTYLEQLSQKQWDDSQIRAAFSEISNSEQLLTKMRQLRREIFSSLIVKDLTGKADFFEVSEVMSSFARNCIESTVRVYAKELAARFGVPHSELGVPQDLLVLGMGKLGGNELNVSSDIDLIFFYDEDGECKPTDQYPNVRKTLSNYEFFERLAKKIIPAISDLTYEGFVFRVDMRLRPNGDSGPIVASNEMLEEYLMVQGRDWERFAYLKGSVVSGPVFCTAEEFEIQKKNLLDVIRPFVFRKYLDFSAISALTDLHKKIRAATQLKSQTSLKCGQNIKLGRGGIREIEFIAQTFQVIRGGRNTLLRERSTLKALSNLAKENVIEQESCDKLSEIYVFLRNLEHALQYVDDQQTQLLPDEKEQKDKVAKMLGMSLEELETKLKNSTEYVAKRFDAIFQTSEERSTDQWPVGWESGAPEALAGVADQLRNLGYSNETELAGKILDLMSMRTLKIINPAAKKRMVQLVLRVVGGTEKMLEQSSKTISREELLERYIKFLEVISGRPTYVSLLLQYPVAGLRVGKLLASSRWAADYLLRHPILLDEMLDERVSLLDDYTPVDFSDYIEKTRARLADLEEDDVEARMNLVREAHHGKLFRLLLADLEGRFTVERLADQLSALADATLELAMEESWKTVPGRHIEVPKMGIMAYGKLGGKELSYASDLDLVFIYDDDDQDAEKIYSRFARRLINWLTATTSSGYLFDIDMRLRPNGESGMLVTSLESFRRYERNEDGTGAWLWEYQALTRARFSAGDRIIGSQFEEERKYILQRKRDRAETAKGVLEMRRKMHEGHPNKTGLFDIKHDAGGMVDVEFIVQFIVLAYSNEHPELVNNFGNIKMLSMAADAGLIEQSEAEEVSKIYRRYRKLQHEFRLNSSDSTPVRFPPEQFEHDAQAVKNLWNKVFGL